MAASEAAIVSRERTGLGCALAKRFVTENLLDYPVAPSTLIILSASALLFQTYFNWNLL
jgi:hypothetical protein